MGLLIFIFSAYLEQIMIAVFSLVGRYIYKKFKNKEPKPKKPINWGRTLKISHSKPVCQKPKFTPPPKPRNREGSRKHENPPPPPSPTSSFTFNRTTPLTKRLKIIYPDCKFTLNSNPWEMERGLIINCGHFCYKLAPEHLSSDDGGNRIIIHVIDEMRRKEEAREPKFYGEEMFPPDAEYIHESYMTSPPPKATYYQEGKHETSNYELP